MKTYLFGLLFLGLTNLILAQNEIAAFDPANTMSKTATTNTIKNVAYLTSANVNNMAKHIIVLRQRVANYNVKTAKVYTPKSPAKYDVVFKEGSNKIKAVYNHDGDILSCDETFENIKLPYVVAQQVAKDHPGWEFNTTWCHITYAKGNETKVVYKIALKRGNRKKTIKVTP